MGKQKAPRRVAENEALSVGGQIRGSAQKLNLVAGLIRGKKAEEALNILSFSPKAMARDVQQGARLARSPMPRTTTISTSTASSSPRPASARASR